MKITNLCGLPDPLVRAVTNNKYDKGGADYSVTELIKPPRIAALERQHWQELTEDASDRLWALMGSAGHEVLRRSSDGGIVEERCIVEFEGRKISGQLDYAVGDKAIYDYKFTSLWAVKDGVKPEWEQQLNLYAWLAAQYGVEVSEIKIIAIFRDWSKAEAARDRTYPQNQVAALSVPMWPAAQVEEFLRQRIAAHETARAGTLPFCTAEEVWEKPERYAAMKKGNQKASRVMDSQSEILQWIASQTKSSDFSVEIRPAERPRCSLYCAVGAGGFCSQFNDWKKGQTI